MAYLEPGVYSKTISNRPNTGTGGPALIPLVIGSGAKELKTSEVITRGTGESDILPKEAIQIISIGYTTKKSDFTKSVDYELDGTDAKKIKWLTTQGAKKPVDGEKYSVTYTYAVPKEQYYPKVITASTLSEYGSDINVDGTINNIYVAANILLETGVPEVIMLQVEPNAQNKVGGAEYQLALDKYAQFIDSVYRIIPADCADEINSVIDGHVKKCSSYEERKERCAIYSKGEAHNLSTASEVITSIGGAAKSKSNERVVMVYPASATKVMSNGETKVLTGQFIAAAIAGMEASMPLYKSKTRATSGVFKELLGVELTRSEKNKLAENGICILEQPAGAGTNVICRHQLTTNMDSAEYREMSVQACKDYTAKTLRSILDTYIGKYNITPDTITKIIGSVNSAFSTLISEGYLIEGAIDSIAQDENNPDTIILDVKIKVPYPCNYIKLTIVSE